MFETGNVDEANASTWKLPHTLTILATYKCTAACEQCCFQSNPSITRCVPQDRLRRYIEEAAEVGTFRLICFSGGEPFVLGDDLVELVERAVRRGFLTRIVTNGYWAVSERAAWVRLGPLIEAGLNEINFSTGDDHVKFVPLERVLTGMAVAHEHGLGLALMVEAQAMRAVTKETVLAGAERWPELLQVLRGGGIPVIESPWMKFSAAGDAIEQAAERLVNRRNVHLRRPCNSVLTTAVVTPTEDLGLCCGLPREEIPDLHAGNLRGASMNELLEKSRADFLKVWLFVEGPERILAWAASKDLSIEWEDRYAHNCDACRALYGDPRVMKAIEEHFEEKYAEVMSTFALYIAGGRPRPGQGQEVVHG